MISINDDAASPEQKDTKSDNDPTRIRSSNERSDSTPSCSVLDRRNFYESFTITKSDKLTHASCDALNTDSKPKKKPTNTGGLVDRTLHKLARDVEEKGIIPLDKKLQLKRQFSQDKLAQADAIKSASEGESSGAVVIGRRTRAEEVEEPEMPSKFYNDAPSEHQGPRPRTKTIAPLDLDKHENEPSSSVILPHNTATLHSTFYAPTVSAAEVKSQTRRRKDRKVRHAEATIAEGYGYDVIEKSEFAAVLASHSQESIKDAPDSGLGIDEKNELANKHSKMLEEMNEVIPNRKYSLFPRKAKTVNLPSPPLSEEAAPNTELPSPTGPGVCSRSESMPYRRFQNMLKKGRSVRHTTDNVELPQDVHESMSQSIDKSNIYSSSVVKKKTSSEEQCESLSDSSGFSGGSMPSMPSTSDPSLSLGEGCDSLFPAPVEDDEGQRALGDRGTITISTFVPEQKDKRSSTSDSMPRFDGDDQNTEMNFNSSNEDLLYNETRHDHENHTDPCRSDTVVESELQRRTDKRWSGPETIEVNEKQHFGTLAGKKEGGSFDKSGEWMEHDIPRRSSGGFSEPSMPDEYNNLGNLSAERKTTILENENVRLFQETHDNNEIELVVGRSDSNSLSKGPSSGNSSACSTRENSPVRSGTWEPVSELKAIALPKRNVSSPIAKQVEQKLKPKHSRKLSRQPTLHATGRKNWAEHEEVKKSGVLVHLHPKQIKFNETMYELLITEVSYLKTLETACDVFLEPLEQHAKKSDIKYCTKFEVQKLFVNIQQLRELSEKLLNAMEEKQGSSVVMQNFLPEITHFLKEYYPPAYKYYAMQKKEQEKTLEKVLQNPNFKILLEKLQEDKRCRNQGLKSFLAAPIQKITRFPLMMSAVADLCEARAFDFQIETYDSALEALDAAKTLSTECDEAEDKISQVEKLIEIQKSLDMPEGTPPGVLIKLLRNKQSAESRKLLKEGELLQVTGKGRVAALKTQKRYLFFFSDLLLITNFNSETKRFVALEVGREFKVNRNRSDLYERYGKKLGFSPQNTFWSKCFFLACAHWWKSEEFANEDKNGEPITPSSNKEFLFQLNDQAERDRWHEAIKGSSKLFPKLPPAEDFKETEDKSWFKVITSYEAKQADELTVYPGTFVKVFKPSNNWVKAILLNDKLSIGWLPTEYLQQETNTKSIREKETKLRATKNNLDKLEKKLDPIIF